MPSATGTPRRPNLPTPSCADRRTNPDRPAIEREDNREPGPASPRKRGNDQQQEKRLDNTYEVATADGAREPYWEFNLRFKTDGSELGPEPGKPVIVGAGMVGDRASVVFASPQEISPSIVPGC